MANKFILGSLCTISDCSEIKVSIFVTSNKFSVRKKMLNVTPNLWHTHRVLIKERGYFSITYKYYITKIVIG
jgi:hypothetical protein